MEAGVTLRHLDRGLRPPAQPLPQVGHLLTQKGMKLLRRSPVDAITRTISTIPGRGQVAREVAGEVTPGIFPSSGCGQGAVQVGRSPRGREDVGPARRSLNSGRARRSSGARPGDPGDPPDCLDHRGPRVSWARNARPSRPRGQSAPSRATALHPRPGGEVAEDEGLSGSWLGSPQGVGGPRPGDSTGPRGGRKTAAQAGLTTRAAKKASQASRGGLVRK